MPPHLYYFDGPLHLGVHVYVCAQVGRGVDNVERSKNRRCREIRVSVCVRLPTSVRVHVHVLISAPFGTSPTEKAKSR